MPQNKFLMHQKLLIFFIYQQQFLCHATWATRTATSSATFVPQNEATTKIIVTTTAGTPTSPTPPKATTPLVVSSSEATLLTGNLLLMTPMPQRMQSRNLLGGKFRKSKNAYFTKNMLNNTTSQTKAENPILSSSEASADEDNNNRHKIIAIYTNCSRDIFEMHINLNRGFRGLLYAKDFPLECRARGTSHTNITLRLPTSGCGVRAEPRTDGNMELSVRIMLQMEQKLRQSSDILKTVRCKLPLNAMGMTVTSKENNKQRQNNYRNGRMRNFDSGKMKNKSQKKSQQPETPTEEQEPKQKTPRVRIWLELGDRDGSGAVEVGQETTLTVRAIVPGKMGVRVVDCAALDGLGESTQQLLDDRGCPLDEQVMPALHTSLKPAEEGWSKQNEDDLVEKTFTATFPAFKFPDRERLHVSCGVQLCKGSCPEINCHSTEPLILSLDKHLARIEVFNSLAVTAPQIEVDRLRYDRRYNMSVEEYPSFVRQLPTEGTLCMSVSKLAISFCILGVIFLAAVIVAISSLIRSRQRNASLLTFNSSRIHRAEVCTSMFSSSSADSTQSARFGSKLFMPYYPPANLPYGRVY